MALEGYSENGIPEAEDENLSAAETVRRTIRQDDGQISFRVRSGKGSKPAKLGAEDFSEVVDLLRSTVDAVENAGLKLSRTDEPSFEELRFRLPRGGTGKSGASSL